MNSPLQNVMGFDFGTQKMGIATGNSLTATAQPLPLFPMRDGIPDWDKLEQLIAELLPRIEFKHGGVVHQAADWPAALLCGIAYNLVAVRTGSLSACILAHAITNLGLGIYIMSTRQWGFW